MSAEFILSNFNKNVFELIPERENMPLDPSGVYYTIMKKGEPVGVVGFIPSRFEKNSGFIQIALIPEYRGRGILRKAEILLAEKHGLKRLYATIDKDNIPSITSHLRAGFRSISKTESTELRDKGLLDENSIRLVMDIDRG